MISSMLVFARNFLGTLLREATRETGVPEHAVFACWGGDVPRSQGQAALFRRVWKMFFAFFAQKIFWKPKPEGHRLRRNHLSVSGDPCAAVCEAEPRSSRRAREKHRASDRGRAGEKLEEWRSRRNCPQTGATAQDALQATANRRTFCLAAVRATSSQRVKCTHTKPHFVCSPPRNRARHGRQMRWNAAAPFRCRHGKQLRNAPHGNTADPARYRWHGGASLRCITI